MSWLRLHPTRVRLLLPLTRVVRWSDGRLVGGQKHERENLILMGNGISANSYFLSLPTRPPPPPPPFSLRNNFEPFYFRAFSFVYPHGGFLLYCCICRWLERICKSHGILGWTATEAAGAATAYVRGRGHWDVSTLPSFIMHNLAKGRRRGQQGANRGLVWQCR